MGGVRFAWYCKMFSHHLFSYGGLLVFIPAICLHGIQCEEEGEKEEQKLICTIKKNIWEEVILYCHAFRNCFPISENITKIHAIRFLLFVSKRNMKFCHKIFRYQSFPTITGHGTEKVLPFSFICVQTEHEILS